MSSLHGEGEEATENNPLFVANDDNSSGLEEGGAENSSMNTDRSDDGVALATPISTPAPVSGPVSAPVPAPTTASPTSPTSALSTIATFQSTETSSSQSHLLPQPPVQDSASVPSVPETSTSRTSISASPPSAAANTPIAAQSHRRSLTRAQQEAPLPPSPPLPQPPSQHQQARRLSQQEYVLPRWQPDSDASYCPICFSVFSIFVRKHHCRKCGRVVCANCSPHRITIPYPYIVQPPDAPPRVPSAVNTRTGAPSGGDRVRLCNPCVPDPNTAPPSAALTSSFPASAPRTGSHMRSSSGSISSSYDQPNAGAASGLRRYGFNFLAQSSTNAAPAASSTSSSSYLYNTTSSPSNVAGDRRFTTSGPQVQPFQYNYGSSHPTSSFAPSTNALYGSVSGQQSQQQRSHRLSLPPQPAGLSASAIQFQAHAQEHHQRQYMDQLMHQRQQQHLPQQPQNQHLPRHQIAEEDECPVCRRELPKRTLPNFETLREAHIEECIVLHSQFMGGGSGSRARSANNTTTTTTGPISADTAAARRDDTLSGGEASSPSVGSSLGSGSSSQPHQHSRAMHRYTGIFPYKATEKDCVGDAECTICLEDLEVGVPMARLECFCRFHEKCIRAWFVRHPGRCPVHQHGMAD